MEAFLENATISQEALELRLKDVQALYEKMCSFFGVEADVEAEEEAKARQAASVSSGGANRSGRDTGRSSPRRHGRWKP